MDNALTGFLRLSKLFGVFQVLKDGSLKCSPYSPFTFLAVVFSLAYTGAILYSFIFNVLLENHRLSYILTILPNAILTVVADYLIRISSILYSSELSQFVAVTGEARWNEQDHGFVDWFWRGLSVLFLTCCTVINVATVIGTINAGAGIGTVMASTWTMLSGFFHDGGNVCALGFVLMSGMRIVSNYEGLCGEMLEFCRDKNASVSFTAVANAEKHYGAVNISACADHGQKLVDRFGQLRLAFGIFSKIGGVFILALVLDMTTWLYSLACTVLFNQYCAPSAFMFAMTVFGALLDVLVLVAVAELGHQMKNRVI